ERVAASRQGNLAQGRLEEAEGGPDVKHDTPGMWPDSRRQKRVTQVGRPRGSIVIGTREAGRPTMGRRHPIGDERIEQPSIITATGLHEAVKRIAPLGIENCAVGPAQVGGCKRRDGGIEAFLPWTLAWGADEGRQGEARGRDDAAPSFDGDGLRPAQGVGNRIAVAQRSLGLEPADGLREFPAPLRGIGRQELRAYQFGQVRQQPALNYPSGAEAIGKEVDRLREGVGIGLLGRAADKVQQVTKTMKVGFQVAQLFSVAGIEEAILLGQLAIEQPASTGLEVFQSRHQTASTWTRMSRRSST